MKRKYIYAPRPQESCKLPLAVREYRAKKTREYRQRKKKKEAASK